MGRASGSAEASIIVMNTCTMISRARIKMRAPRSAAPAGRILTRKIVVTGCYAQRAPEEIAALPGRELGGRQLP